MGSTPVKHSVLNVKAVVAAFNQAKALVGAFSVIVQLYADAGDWCRCWRVPIVATIKIWIAAIVLFTRPWLPSPRALHPTTPGQQ